MAAAGFFGSAAAQGEVDFSPVSVGGSWGPPCHSLPVPQSVPAHPPGLGARAGLPLRGRG